MDITVALTPDEAQDMAQKMIMIHQLKLADEDIGPMYGPEQRHAFYDTVYELIGVKYATPYLLPPESPQYQQAMQQQQQQKQMAMQKQDQMLQLQAQAQQSEQMRRDQELQNKILDTTHDNDLDDDKFIHEVEKDHAEFALEQEQERPVSVG
jgi:hypothetical protein